MSHEIFTPQVPVNTKSRIIHSKITLKLYFDAQPNGIPTALFNQTSTPMNKSPLLHEQSYYLANIKTYHIIPTLPLPKSNSYPQLAQTLTTPTLLLISHPHYSQIIFHKYNYQCC